jgi:anthranilate phosphoribosyltransferase
MITSLLNRLIAREDLTQTEAAALLAEMMSDTTSDAEIAATLIALSAKGETEEELAGFAETMRERAARVKTRHERFVDTCGTGGSAAKTFNISTASAFVVAAAGVPVAKHGNVGVTTKAGSADVLRALGLKIELTPKRVAESLDSIGIGFMFAPLHHASTRRVAQVRRELGVRTIFNLLGPLTNPAGAPFQIVGASHPTAGERLARALARLGARRAWVVRGEDGLDEITLAGRTIVYEASSDGVRKFEVAPEDFGLRRATLDGLRNGSADENAGVIRAVLAGERRDAARDLVVANAAAALYITGASMSLPGAVELASQAINEGKALAKLEALRDFSLADE